MTYRDLASGWGTAARLALLAAGIFGFFPNPVVGEPGRLFATDAPLNAVHVALGIAALAVAWAPDEGRRAGGLAVVGLALIALAAVELAAPGLGHVLRGSTNPPVQAATAALGVSSWFLGLLARAPEGVAGRDAPHGRDGPSARTALVDATRPAGGGAGK